MKHLLADYLQMLAGHGLLSQTEETLSERLGESLQREITLVSCDSRKVIPGTLYLQGSRISGGLSADGQRERSRLLSEREAL